MSAMSNELPLELAYRNGIDTQIMLHRVNNLLHCGALIISQNLGLTPFFYLQSLRKKRY